MRRGNGAWLLAVCLIVSGCSQAVTATEQPAVTHVANTPTSPPPQFTPSVTAPTPTPTAAPTRRAAATRRPTSTPGVTVTQPSLLNVRQPTLQQLSDYLQSYFPDFYGFDANTQFESEDISGDGQPDLVSRDKDFSDDGVALAVVYQDVNNDGEPDLLIFGWDGLFVVLWSNDHYDEPFRIGVPFSRGVPPTVTVTLQDWTGDGGPDITFDIGTLGGGSGLFIWFVSRSLVHCFKSACQVVWQDTYSSDTDDYSTGGLAQYHINMQSSIDANGAAVLRIIDKGFSVYCCSEWGLDYDDHKVFTSTMTTFAWDGNTFNLSDRQIVSQARTIFSQSTLTSTGAQGSQAAISWRENASADHANEYCQLFLDGGVVGTYFGCRHKFTTVEWKDITGDGVEDIVVTAYSAGSPYGPDGLLSDESCMHQRLLAYQWSNGKATEIANVAGCVIQSDLYGVRLQDYDQDGQVEILTAPNNGLNNRAYKWNGKRFVLWSDVPIDR